MTLDTKLKDLEAGAAPYGGRLEGLDYSVKGLDSLRRKVASDVAKEEDASDVVAGTRDMNRYTICFPAESYSDGVAAGFDRLQGLGLQPYNPEKTHKNTWNDPSYKGINTSWQDQDTGQFVEVQFHTPESFRVKSDNHALYELSRSGSLEIDEQLAADWLQAQRYEDVEIPQGHDSTVPAKPSRELATFTPEALERVRAKEAELKQPQAGESPALEQPEADPPRSADATNVTQAEPEHVEKDVPEPPEAATTAKGESPDVDVEGQDAHEAESPPAAEDAQDQGAGASYDDHENEQMSAQDATGEGPESEASENVFPQPVDEGVAESRKTDSAAEEQSSGESDEADTGGQGAEETDRSSDAEDAQGAGASYDDHEDEQMARISAADERQESDDRDDYGDTSFSTEDRERGGVGD